MAAHVAPASLDALALKAGVSPYLIKYLRERGLVSVGAVALLSPDADHFSRTLVSPLETGWAGSQTYQLTSEEVCIAQANMKYLREFCLGSRRRPLSPLAGSVAKPPSELPAGDWQPMCSATMGSR